MRQFPPNLKAALARTDGALTVWILRFTAAGVDFVLSQDAVEIGPWGVTALPWIESWGQLQEGVTGTLADYGITQLDVNLINDPDATPNLRSLAKSRALNCLQMSVYLWVEGCPDAPFEMFRFRVQLITFNDEASVDITLQDESIKFENYSPGTVISTDAYPDADPTDVGKIIPIVFGNVKSLRTLAIDAGIQTGLTNAIAALTTSVKVTTGTVITPGMVLQVDDEQIQVTAVNGDVCTVVRGVNGTLAATHQRGAVAWETKDFFYYAVADHPLASIPKAYCLISQVAIDISLLCTVWPDGSHPSYPGKAVIGVPGYITLPQAVSLAIADGIQVDAGTLKAVMGGNVAKTGTAALGGNITKTGTATLGGSPSLSGSVSLSGLITLLGSLLDPGHGHTTTGGTLQGLLLTQLPSPASQYGWNGDSSQCYVTTQFQATGQNSTTSYSVTINPLFTAANVTVYAYVYWKPGDGVGGGKTQVFHNTYNMSNGSAFTISFSASSTFDAIDIVFAGYNIGMSFVVTAASLTVQVGSTPSSSNSTGVSLGTVAANNGTLAATNGTLSVSTGTLSVNDSTGVSLGTLTINDGIAVNNGTLGVSLSGAVAKSGTVNLTGNSVANTLVGEAILVDCVSPMTAPQDCITYLLGATCQIKGTLPSCYSFNGAITESKLALDWCHNMARQARSYFRWLLGQPTLIVRPNALVPIAGISEVRLSQGAMVHSQVQTDIGDVINTITLRYNRDWGSTTSGDTAYMSVKTGTGDPASLAAYGTRQRDDLFRCDFVTSDAMAADLLAFFLLWYAWQRWTHTYDTYLWQAALEFADPVSLDFSEGEIGEVSSMGFNPGNSNNIEKITMAVNE